MLRSVQTAALLGGREKWTARWKRAELLGRGEKEREGTWPEI